MKKLKSLIKPLNKIQIIFLVCTIIITSIFTVLNFYQNKDDSRYYSQTQRFAANVKNDLAYLNSLEYVVGRNHNNNFLGEIIAYDPDFYPKLFQPTTCSFSITYEDTPSSINFDGLEFDQLKKIADLLDASNTSREPVNITFNYDAIRKDNTVIVDNLIYLKINDTEILSQSSSTVITVQLDDFYTQFFNYDYDKASQTSYFSDRYNVHNYLKKFCQDTIKENKYDQNGFYQQIDPKDNPVEIGTYNDDQGNDIKPHIRYCFQILSLKYNDSAYQYNKPDLDHNQPVGYLVWYEIDKEFYTYSFFAYLLEHYYMYLILLVYIALMLFFLKTKNTPVIEAKPIVSKTPLHIKKVENIQPLDLENYINDLIKTSENLLIFKKITINFMSTPTTINGNYDAVNLLVNNLFNYMLKHSDHGSTITIKLEDHRLSFTGKLSNNDFDELASSLEIINNHHFGHTFTDHSLCFYENNL